MRAINKDEMKARRRNIALKIAYDGTNYKGFQRQSPPIIAVQNVLEKSLSKIFGDSIELAAAGRTDTGVHAYGQVVNFFTNGIIPVERIARAANGVLPADIAVLAACEASYDFSARHSATAKTYVYNIERTRTRNPFCRDYAWQIFRPLDVANMRAALNQLIGTHDFSSFRAAGGKDMSPVRTLHEIELVEDKSTLACRIYGNGFLYHMVRNIISTVVDVGLGRISLEKFAEIFASGDRSNASPTAPASGLYLASVEYGDEELNWVE